MKKLFLAALVSGNLLIFHSDASVAIDIGMGDFYASPNTSTAFANGGLINILARTDGSGWGNAADIFTNLTGSFVPTGSALVASFITTDPDGPGTLGTSFNFDLTPGGIAAGQPLILVGYSSLNALSTSPGLGTSGFFFRTDAVIDGSDTGWFVPSDGSLILLSAYTMSLGGSLPNNQFTSGAGAEGGSGFTTVPEPSTYALLSLAVLALGAYAMRRRSRA
jgi:hypothetical protein